MARSHFRCFSIKSVGLSRKLGYPDSEEYPTFGIKICLGQSNVVIYLALFESIHSSVEYQKKKKPSLGSELNKMIRIKTTMSKTDSRVVGQQSHAFRF